ncbi:hypothetical protein D3C73_1436680 [compost metagenome]
MNCAYMCVNYVIVAIPLTSSTVRSIGYAVKTISILLSINWKFTCIINRELRFKKLNGR